MPSSDSSRPSWITDPRTGEHWFLDPEEAKRELGVDAVRSAEMVRSDPPDEVSEEFDEWWTEIADDHPFRDQLGPTATYWTGAAGA